METLLDRIKKEHLVNLAKNSVKYPLSTKNIEDVLASKKFWGELTMSEIRTIIEFCDVACGKWTANDWKFGTQIFND